MEPIKWQGRIKDHEYLLLDAGELKEVVKTLAHIDRDEFGMDWTPFPSLIPSPCRRLGTTLYIRSNGKVQACPAIDICLGDIRRNRLQEIFATSEVLQQLRELPKRLSGRCGNCEYRRICYGCRGHAFQSTGNLFAEDSLCWR